MEIWATLLTIRIASARSQMVTARTANRRNHGNSEARLVASTMLPQFIPATFSLFSSHSASR